MFADGLGRGLSILLSGAVLGLSAPSNARAETYNDAGFASELVATLAPFSLVGMAWAPDGRLFVWQKNGVVRVIKQGTLVPTPFLDFSSKVNTFDDRGFWGLAFHPDSANNGFIYMSYVFEEGGNPNDGGPKTARLTRVRSDPANPDVMLPGSEVVILGSIGIPPCSQYGPGADCIADDSGTHTLGTIRFAPDGTIFLGNGDGAEASFADPNALRAQNLDSWEGKILRIREDGSAPGDNPFDDGTNSIRSRVWAYGVRNPFRFSLHPTTNEPYFGDVGWNAYEEVNRGVRGKNFGWPCYEGDLPQPGYQAAFVQCQQLSASAVTFPLFTYDRSVGAAVIGGAFYTGNLYPQVYQGNLFFADYVGGFIRRMVLDANGNSAGVQIFATGVEAPVTLELGPDGMLYYLSFTSGQIRRVRFNGPVAVAAATPTTGYTPLTVFFSSAGSSDPGGGALTFLWDFGDGTTSTAANPSHTYTATGVSVFTARLTVRNPGGLTSSTTLTITVGSQPPVPTILAPADGTVVNPGMTVVFQGSATDPDEGALPASALKWTVLLRHNTHVHTFVGGAGTQGSFVAENHGPIGTFSYTIILTATDSSGLQTSTSINLPVASEQIPPTIPAGLAATAASSSQIDLSWTASTDNVAVTAYLVERCQGASCTNFVQVGTASLASVSDIGLAASTTYRYRVRATDGSGNLSGYSNVASATTFAPDTTAPTAPSALTATAAGPTQISLAWTASTDNLGVTGYRVERCQGAGCVNFAEIAAVGVTPGFGDTGLAASTAYSYRVRATDAAGNFSGYSNVASGTTLVAPPSTGLVAAWGFSEGSGTTVGDASGNGNSGTLNGATWSTAGRFGNALSFNGINNLVLVPFSASLNVGAAMTLEAWIFPTAAQSGWRTIVQRETDAYSLNASNDAGPLRPAGGGTFGGAGQWVSGPAASPVNAWTHVALTYNGATLTLYVNGVQVASQARTGTVETNGNPLRIGGNVPYGEYFQGIIDEVRIYNRALTQAEIQTDMNTPIDPLGPDTLAPTAPSGLTANAVSGTQINLAWTASTDNVGVSGYRVERCAGVSCTAFVQMATPTATGFNDTGLTAGTSYSYRVRASDAAGNLSAYSNIATASTPIPDTTPPTAPSGLTATAISGSQITVAWTASTDNVGVTAYLVERCQGAGCTSFAQVLSQGGTSFSDLGLAGSTSYSYRVRATDAAGNLSGYSNIASATTPAAPDTTPPTAPSVLSATVVSSSQIDLGWTASTDNVGVTAYLVERCQGAGCTSFAQVGTTSLTSFSDIGLAASTTYRYRVRATDGSGNLSAFSSIVTATTAAIPDTIAPTAPSGLTATVVTSSQITLGWIASTDNVAVTSYLVERCQGAGCTNFVQMGTTSLTTLGDTGLAASTAYSYRVRATDAAGNFSGYSNVASGTTLVAPPSTGLVAAWGFSEGSGTTVGDASGNGNSGTLNGATWSTAGRFGNALSFNGINNLVLVPFSASLNVGAAMTLEAWIFPTAAQSGWRTIVQRETDAYSLNASNDAGPLRPAGGGTFGGAGQWVSGPAASPVNAWTHVALTYNGATLTLYVNGVQVASQARTGTVETNGNPLRIGGNVPYGEYFQGIIDEVRIYNRALTQAEIQTDMNTPIDPLGPDTLAPTAPSGLTANAVSGTQINLAWTASTDNVGVSGYRVERCAGVSCTAFVQMATPTATGFNDTGLTAGTSYSYRVRASDAAGNLSAYSNIATASTPIPDTTPPTAPSGLTATAISGSQITVAWTASTDNVGVTAYLVERCQGAGCTSFAQVLSQGGTSFSDLGLAGSTSYSYRVRATDAAGNLSGYSNIASATTPAAPDTTPPTAPSVLSATVVSSSQIDLGWTASTDNVGVTAYLVERCQGAGCTSFAQVGTTSLTSFSDIGLAASTTYRYRVRATDGSGNLSAFSSIVTATTAAIPDTIAPTAPSGLTATVVTSSQITLGWIASTDNVAVTSYLVERCQGAGCTNFVQMGTTSLTTLGDTGLAASTAYSYRVRATDAAGNFSGYSNIASATTPAPPDATAPTAPSGLTASAVSSSQINLAWTASTDNVAVTAYLVERCQGAGCTTFTQVGTSSVTSFSNTGLTASTTYRYRVRATDAAGNLSAFSSIVSAATLAASDTTAPTAPSGLTASVISSSQINLAWNASTDNVGVTGYIVQRCQGAGCTTFAQVGTSSITSFSDIGLAASTTYRYRVRATDAAGNLSAFSSIVTTATQAAPDVSPPSVPTALTATVISGGQINLTWGVSIDNVGVTGYRVERCQDVGCATFAQIAAVGAVTSFNNTGLAVNTSYSYRVRATDAAGNFSGYSNVASGTTLSTPPPTGLVAAWGFNEGSGTTVGDASGNGNSGTLNGATWSTAGKFGNALSFNGTNNLVLVPFSASLNVGAAMTLEAWIFPTAAQGGWRTIVQRETDAYSLNASNDAGPLFPAGGGTFGGTGQWVSGPSASPIGTWTHVALTYNGATLTLYVNGVQVASQGRTGTVETNSNPLRIGGNVPYGEFFQGIIDEVRIYNRALTQAEIQTDMNTPISP